MIVVERDSVLCEVCAETEGAVFRICTGGVLCEVQALVEEMVEH
jgi:hypothetical protein